MSHVSTRATTLNALTVLAALAIGLCLSAPAEASPCGALGERGCCWALTNPETAPDGKVHACSDYLYEDLSQQHETPLCWGCSGLQCPLHNFLGFESSGICQVRCGYRVGDRACTIFEEVPSCKRPLVEYQGVCVTADGYGFPTACGGENENACDIIAQIANGTGPCHPGLSEDAGSVILSQATCERRDADGFPLDCGGLGERYCDVWEIPIACKSGTDALSGLCLDPEDMPQSTPAYAASEVPPGPRTIVLIHGSGGSRNFWFDGNDPNATFFPEFLHDPAYGFNLLVVDYNAADQDPGAPFRIFAWNPATRSLDERLRLGWGLYGTRFTLPTLSRFIAEGLRDHGAALGVQPNVTIVAHSMGGLVARDLVARHYASLRNAGVRIAEVVTMATPHRGGGSGINEVIDLQEASCVLNRLYPGDPFLHQACIMERWQNALKSERGRRGADAAPYIDNLDFPQIRWITLASPGSDNRTNSIFGNHLVAHDGSVADVSAYGIATDLCFPSVDSAPVHPAILARGLASVPPNGAWIEHHWPPDVQAFGLLQLLFYAYNPYNRLDVNPAAVITHGPSNDSASLRADCHSPGPSSANPHGTYLTGSTAPDYVRDPAALGYTECNGPSGPLCVSSADLLGRYDPHLGHGLPLHPSTMNYLKTVLTDGLRGADVDRDGSIDDADRQALFAAFPGSGGPNSAHEHGFEVSADLDGDGFVTFLDLQRWQQLAPASSSAAASASSTVTAACGLLGIEPLLLLFGLRAVRRRKRRLCSARLALLLAALASFAAAPAGATAILDLTSVPLAVAPGGTFVLEIRADLSAPVVGFGFDVHWDAGALVLEGPAVFGPAWFGLSDFAVSSSQQSVAGAALAPGGTTGADVLLVTLGFRSIAGPGPTPISLSIQNTDATEGFPLFGSGFDAYALDSAIVNVPEPTTAALVGCLGLWLAGRPLRRRR